MNAQKGALKLKGTHGDFTFTETQDGFVWKKKLKPIGIERIMNEPQFEKQRHNMSLFGRTGKAVKLLRRSLSDELEYAKDGRLTPRLQTVMMEVTKSDTQNERGDRLPGNGQMAFLQNFELNAHAQLRHSLAVDIETTYDRATGVITVKVPSFVPKQSLKRAPNATHFSITATAVELDFANDDFIKATDETADAAITATATTVLTLSPSVSAGSTLPVLVVVGIRFSQVVNGFTYPEKHGPFNALCIVKGDNI